MRIITRTLNARVLSCIKQQNTGHHLHICRHHSSCRCCDTTSMYGPSAKWTVSIQFCLQLCNYTNVLVVRKGMVARSSTGTFRTLWGERDGRAARVACRVSQTFFILTFCIFCIEMSHEKFVLQPLIRVQSARYSKYRWKCMKHESQLELRQLHVIFPSFFGQQLTESFHF